jgi:2-succinyl-5-enolpyruvyl-6-hydroxy-3-cyclohexene-1-carboxylate synthase
MTPNRSKSPATDFSVALLHEYVRLGLTDVVLSPGSRSQALALVVAEYERAGLVRLRVRIDERVGGFLALGLAVETGRPVLIITTSGTAVANLHPAVLEAHHSGVPLIVASADRPDELRHIGSNQTAEQPGIFGAATTRNWDVSAPVGDPGEAELAAAIAHDSWVAATVGHSGRPGPVHLNLAFREPLSGPVVLPDHTLSPDGAVPPDGAVTPDAAMLPDRFGMDAAASTTPSLPEPTIGYLSPAPGTVVVAGAGAGERAEETARALGVPLLAEVTSGAHFGPNLVVSYRQLLASDDFGAHVRRVIVFGHPTLSREIPALIARPDVDTTVVRTPGADDYNPGHRVHRFVDQVEIAPESAPSREARAWVGSWVAASRALLEPETSAIRTEPGNPGDRNPGDRNPGDRSPAELSPVDLSNAAFARRQLGIVREPVTRRMLVEAVWRSTWPHDRLVLGASRLIREADQVVTGKRIRAHANRGLAGIDGTVATALGIALASQGTDAAATGTTRVLLGDLTALHDVGALAFGVGETRPRIQVIVGNDGGGTIFDGLEVAGSGEASALDRVMFTAQNVDFAKLAAAFGWDYLLVSNRGELDEALAASTGPLLVEVPLAR